MKSKRAFLHIGTGKTGTTTIQQSCKKSKSLVHSGINYPLFPGFEGQGNQNCLSLIYKTFEKLPRQYKSRYLKSGLDYQSDVDRIRKHFYEILDSSDKIVISAEYLTNFSIDEINCLVSDLRKNNFQQIQVVIYVRHPISYYISFIQQKVKASYQIQNPEKFKYHFKKWAANWSSVFPRSVKIIPFEKELLRGNGLLQNFETLLKDFFESERLELTSVTRKNQTMSLEAFVMLLQYRKNNYFDIDNIFRDDSDELRKMLNDVGVGTRIELNEKYQQVIVKNHKDDLKWLKKQFKVEFNEYDSVDEIDNENDEHVGTENPEELFKSYDTDKIYKAYSTILFTLLNKAGNEPLSESSG